MANTIPSDAHVVGDPGHTTDHNNMADMLTLLAQVNVRNTAYAGGADPTGSADSATAFNAARAAIPAGGGAITVPPGTYKIGSTVGPFTTGQWLACAPGVVFNFTGTGDCFRWVDTSTYSSRSIRYGGLTGAPPVIDGTSAGAGSSALHAGDIYGLRADLIVSNFSGAGSIGVHFDNANFWTEHLYARIYVTNCATGVVFDCSGATTSTGSYDRADIDIHCGQGAGQPGVVFQNGAFIADGRLGIYGNFATSASPFTAAVLKLTGSAPAGHPASGSGIVQSVLNIGVESDGGLANAFQTINFGAPNSIAGCSGVIDFNTASLFAVSNNGGQFQFHGPIVGDSTLTATPFYGEFPITVTANGQTLFSTLGAVIAANPGASSFTGLILPAGIYSGQIAWVINKGTGSLTFAAAATSKVADGVSDVIAGLTARGFVWDSATSLWYRMG